MTPLASQITSLTVVYTVVYSDTDQRKYQSSGSLAFVRGIHRDRWIPPYKGPVTRKMFPFGDVIMSGCECISATKLLHITTVCTSLTWRQVNVAASKITGRSTVYSTACIVCHQRKDLHPRCWSFVRGYHQDRWIPLTKGQQHGGAFPSRDAIRYSWCVAIPNGITRLV